MQNNGDVMNIRVLRSDEYGLLKGIADGFVPDPDNSVAVVAFKDGHAVGRMMLVAAAHAEGPWIEEHERGGTLLHRMESALTTEAKDRGLGKILAYASSAKNSEYLERLGYRKLGLEVWEKEI